MGGVASGEEGIVREGCGRSEQEGEERGHLLAVVIRWEGRSTRARSWWEWKWKWKMGIEMLVLGVTVGT